jgi:hypothetical protein
MASLLTISEKCLLLCFEDFETNNHSEILRRSTAINLCSSGLMLYSDNNDVVEYQHRQLKKPRMIPMVA